jgi:hypothetical protein
MNKKSRRQTARAYHLTVFPFASGINGIKVEAIIGNKVITVNQGKWAIIAPFSYKNKEKLGSIKTST